MTNRNETRVIICSMIPTRYENILNLRNIQIFSENVVHILSFSFDVSKERIFFIQLLNTVKFIFNDPFTE